MSLAVDLLATIAVRFVDALLVGAGIGFVALVLLAVLAGPERTVETLLAWTGRRRDPLDDDPEVRARRIMAAGWAEIERQRGRRL